MSNGARQSTGLPDSKDANWQVILTPGREGGRVYMSSAPLSLPGGTRNPRIRPFISGAFVGTIPAEILPLSRREELVGTFITDLNEKFYVGLNSDPSTDRNVPPSFTEHNTSKTVFIGASNLGNLAKVATADSHMVVDLTDRG